MCTFLNFLKTAKQLYADGTSHGTVALDIDIL
jgi:hypothetical protein